MQQNPTGNSPLTIRQLPGLDRIEAQAWNRFSAAGNPFLSYEFLQGLEECDCLEAHGWIPNHQVAYRGNTPVGAVLLYLKTNSYGEFVFDWSWADAYERAGGTYYPKLVSAVPFTPVRGPRILVDPGQSDPGLIRERLLSAVLEMARAAGISSYHCLFPEPPDKDLFARHQLLIRKGIQFHWHNHNYRDFDDFLDTMTSKKRKQIKRERRQVLEAGLEMEILPGDKISDRQWRIFYDFYCSTFHRRWGSPRLTCEFFQLLSRRLPQQTLLILAREQQEYVAGAFAMRGADTLYGRHWGCTSRFPNLHFELCYYQTIDYCIKQGLATLDAGVQGEHKLSRGFEPVVTWSGHWIQHQGFRHAIHEFLEHERPEIDAYIGQLNCHLPYKNHDMVRN